MCGIFVHCIHDASGLRGLTTEKVVGYLQKAIQAMVYREGYKGSQDL